MMRPRLSPPLAPPANSKWTWQRSARTDSPPTLLIERNTGSALHDRAPHPFTQKDGAHPLSIRHHLATDIYASQWVQLNFLRPADGYVLSMAHREVSSSCISPESGRASMLCAPISPLLAFEPSSGCC